MRKIIALVALWPMLAACGGASHTDLFAEAADEIDGDGGAMTAPAVVAADKDASARDGAASKDGGATKPKGTGMDAGAADATSPGQPGQPGQPGDPGQPGSDASTGPTGPGTPTTPLPGVSASWLHACMLTTKGHVACWGDNEYGQLGPGVSDAQSATAVSVPGVTDAVLLSAGVAQTCVVRTGGSVACWGAADGDETTSAIATIPGISSAIQVAAGGESCALLANKTVACWAQSSTPTPLAVSGLSDVVAIAATIAAQCALHTAGDVVCWGKNTDGELGNGTNTPSTTPVAVTGLTDAVQISGAGGTMCALRKNGEVVCWGGTSGSETSSLVPAKITGINNTTMVAAGIDHGCAVSKNFTVSCWGVNPYGGLGDGTTTPSDTAVLVAGLSGAKRVAAGFGFSCASDDSSVYCWGYNADGEIGSGTAGKKLLDPTPVTGL